MSNADGPQTVSVSGGQYRINDGPYRTAAGTASEGDRITLRAVMSPTFSTDQVLSLKVGSTSASLTLTTTIDAVIPLRAYVFQPPGWRASDRRAAYIDWSGGAGPAAACRHPDRGTGPSNTAWS